MEEITIKNKPTIWDSDLNIKWRIGNCKLRLKNNFHSKKYKIYFHKTDNKIFLKPFQKYYEYEFEYIFNFHPPSCQDYDKNRIVFIK